MAAIADHNRRLSEGVLIEASILARVFGIRLLKLDATIVLAPAEVAVQSAAPRDPPARAPVRSPRLAPEQRMAAGDEEISARFFATYAGGYGVWLLYGLSIGSLPLILVDAAGLLCGLVTLAVTLRMRGSLLRPATWAKCPEHAPHTIDRAAGEPAPARA